MSRSGVLVMIGYPIDIGFAIGRLVSVFHDMALELTAAPTRVHFSFARIGEARSTALPADFRQLVEFDPRQPTPQAVQRLVAHVREHDIDTVFALDLGVQAPFLRALRQAGVRQVISYWGAPMSSINRGLKLALKRLEVAWLHRHKPDHFIFESRAMQDMAVHGRGVSAACTTVIPTGVDAQKFRPLPQEAELVYQRFGIPQQRRIIVYMGHLHRRKGVHVLMRAAGHLVSVMRRQDIQVLFLGDRDGEAEGFRDDWAAAGEYITFGGYQSDIPALLAGCHAGCIPSTGWDSFPMSSLEMQACGLPVLVSDWQGVPETIEAGRTGVVVPVGDAEALARAIADLVDDDARRDGMAAQARARIEAGFTRQHQVDALVAWMRRVERA